MTSAIYPHPYYPRDLVLVPAFRERTLSISALITVFFTAILAAILATAYAARKLRWRDRAWVVWFVISGAIHVIVEGFYVLSPTLHAAPPGNFLADVWRFYSLCDSRYVSRDSTVVVLESLAAAVLGPACLATAAAIAAGRRSRWPLQAAVSWGQLYGNVTYLATFFAREARGEPLGVPRAVDPFYFWFLLLGMNGVWVLVPALAIRSAWGPLSTRTEESERGSQKEFVRAVPPASTSRAKAA